MIFAIIVILLCAPTCDSDMVGVEHDHTHWAQCSLGVLKSVIEHEDWQSLVIICEEAYCSKYKINVNFLSKQGYHCRSNCQLVRNGFETKVFLLST